MLAFKPHPSSQKSLTPNLLPCKIHHDGPIPISKRHWDPQPESRKKQKTTQQDQEDGAENPSPPSPSTVEPKIQISYFRGRKLLGKPLTLPEGYEGVIAQRTEEVVVVVPSSQTKGAALGLGRGARHGEEDEDGDDDGEEEEGDTAQVVETKYMDKIAGFEEVVVWGHDAVPGDEDGYVKGLEEWVRFAEGIHAYGETGSSAAAST